MIVTVLLIIAAVVFGMYFLAGFDAPVGEGSRRWGAYRFDALAWCLLSIALTLWHNGK